MSTKTAKPKEAKDRYTSVRLQADDFDNMEKLRDLVITSGWQAIGSKRTSRVTFGTLVSEAVSQVLARVKKG